MLDDITLPSLGNRGLSDNDRAFFQRVFRTDLAVYRRRIEALNFVERRSVLDAGAGFGQWSLALAGRNDSVVALDIDAQRLSVLGEVCRLNRVGNIMFTAGSLESLPFDDVSFDLVFSYGVLFICRSELAIRELARVLRPGGLLYLCTNDYGRFVRDVVLNPNETPDFSARKEALQVLRNSMLRGISSRTPEPSVFSSRRVKRALAKSGLRLIELGPDGSIQLTQAPPPQPFFEGSYIGLRSVFECVAVKTPA